MEFQSITCRSTLTPVCLVYCSARPCQNGRVWSRRYSAITTLIVAGLLSPRPHADPAAAIAQSSARTRRRRLVIEPILHFLLPIREALRRPRPGTFGARNAGSRL